MNLIFYCLKSVLQHVSDQKPKVRYLLALDDSKFTLKQITKAVSKQLTTGKVKILPREDAFLNKEISVSIFEIIEANHYLYTCQ